MRATVNIRTYTRECQEAQNSAGAMNLCRWRLAITWGIDASVDYYLTFNLSQDDG